MEYVAKNRDYIIIRQFLQLYHLYHSYVFHDYNGICHHTVFPNGISKLGYGEKWENGKTAPNHGKRDELRERESHEKPMGFSWIWWVPNQVLDKSRWFCLKAAIDIMASWSSWNGMIFSHDGQILNPMGFSENRKSSNIWYYHESWVPFSGTPK